MQLVRGVPAVLILGMVGCALFVRPDVTAEPDLGDDDQPRQVTVSPIDTERVAPGISTPYWDKVRGGGPLVVGIASPYPPFAVPADPSKVEGDEQWTGFDVELAEHLGRTLGVPVVLVALRSKEVMEQLSSGRIDIGIAGLTRTVFRAAQVNFTHPYLTVTQAALIERQFVDGSRGTDEERRRNTMESYLDLARVSGLKIGTVKDTRPHRLALNHFPNARILPYDSPGAASQALIDGDVDAIVHDAPYIRVWSELNPGQAGRFRALLKPVTREAISMAIRKGDLEFLRFLDAYVQEVQNDGTIDRIYRRHFIDAVWKQKGDLSFGEDSE